MKKLVTICAVVAIASSMVSAAWDQGFETDTSGWFDTFNGAFGYGMIFRVDSGGGNRGLTSASGNAHAEVFQGGPAGDESAPFSRFDGYRDTWPGGMTASLDIYLDTDWDLGSGFDFSVAANGSDNNHQQDFIFHVTKDTSTQKLLVAGSNNTNFNPREDLDTLPNYFEVTNSGWYTFEHVFSDFGDDTLRVDMNLRDSAGTLLFTETRNDPSNVLSTEIGGNRYAWFTNIDIAGGIGIDNHSLTVIPEPATMCLFALGGLMLRRRKKA